MSRSSLRQPSPFRGRWLWATLAIILLCLAFLTLGVWQLNRLSARRAANARLLTRMAAPPLYVSDLLPAPDIEAADLRQATLRGVYDYSQEIILRNRTHNELPGVHVIVPLRLAGSDAAILVDRGWIPYEQAAPDQRAQFRDATGEIELSGILRRSMARSSNLAPADPPLGPDRPRLDAWHRVEIPRIQEQIAYPLLPLFLEEAPPPSGEARRFPRAAPEIALGEGSHLLYAIQWFAFTGIALLGYAFLFHQRAQRT